MPIETNILRYINNINCNQFVLGGSPSTIALIFNIHLKKSLNIEFDLEYSFLKNIYNASVSDEIGKGIHTKFYRDLHRDASAAQLFHDKNDFGFLLNYTEESLISWLNDVDKKNIWYYSNLFLSSYTIAKYLSSSNSRYCEVLKIILDEVLKIRDSKSGLFCLNSAGLLNSMAGTFHFIPILIDSKQLDYNWDALFFNVRKLFFRNGLFSVPGGYSCLDYDSSYLIYSALKYSSTKTFLDEGLSILSQVSVTISDLQNTDGGFSEFLKDNSNPLLNLINVYGQTDYQTMFWMLKKYINVSILNKKIYNNSNSNCVSYPHQSTIFSTWFRLLTYDLSFKLRNDSSLCTNKLVGLNYFE
jgi:hypothetical protein